MEELIDHRHYYSDSVRLKGDDAPISINHHNHNHTHTHTHPPTLHHCTFLEKEAAYTNRPQTTTTTTTTTTVMFGAAVAPAVTPRYTLKQAEARLLDWNDDESGTDIQLRRAFLQPPGVAAEDVLVQHELCLQRGKGIENRKQLAVAILGHIKSSVTKTYTALSLEDAKLILKIYLCDVTTGNRVDRIYASETGQGYVRLTVAWVLSLKDGSVVLDGGRLTEVDDHTYGFGDILGIANAERTLRNMASRMCAKILQQTDIPSRYGSCGCVTHP